MPAWTAFGAVVVVVLALLLSLSWLTQRAMSDGAESADGESPPGEAGTGADDPPRAGPERAADTVTPAPVVREPVPAVESDDDGRVGDGRGSTAEVAAVPDGAPGVPEDSPAAETLTAGGELSGGALLANVAASQGTFTVVLAVAAVATAIPLGSLGMGTDALGAGPLAAGVGLGLGLAVANQGAVRLFRRLDVAFSEDLRELLAPETAGEWAALTLGVLPLVAVFEEFLFRAILIGAFATGFGVDPWLLVVVSSALFAAGHSAQGAAGIVVTGGLGLVLGGAFVLTGSFATVVIAHYLVNALEFLIHEW